MYGWCFWKQEIEEAKKGFYTFTHSAWLYASKGFKRKQRLFEEAKTILGNSNTLKRLAWDKTKFEFI